MKTRNIDTLTKKEILDLAHWIWPVYNTFSSTDDIKNVVQKITGYKNATINTIEDKYGNCIAFGICSRLEIDRKKFFIELEL